MAETVESSAPIIDMYEQYSVSNEEKRTERMWIDKDIYAKIVARNKKNGPRFKFMDGPPFVSSDTLHPGHCNVSFIKDAVLRYFRMNGYHVENMLGYDCHGLPIEMLVNKQLAIKTNRDVEAFGIGNYNEQCKKMIAQFSGAWHPIFNRIGRWVDFSNEYKTMDTKYMESVWWVFQQLWSKGLVYQGSKIMPYSTGCGTPLSNFEASSDDCYKEITDPAVYVKFRLAGTEHTFFVAWTTTPWTLPSNLALTINKNLTYVKIMDKKTGELYIVCQGTENNLYSPMSKEQKAENYVPYDLVEVMSGASLLNKEYEPVFPYFSNNDRKFTVLHGPHVTDKSGTGIVHTAPAFGEDDFNVCVFNNIVTAETVAQFCPIDDAGLFTAAVPDYKGLYCRDTNVDIIKHLKGLGLVVRNEGYLHRYPHCWRTGTPLIYRATNAMFIRVSVLAEQLVEANNKVNWVPSNIGSGRFHQWIKDAKDWCVSRTRYFGNCIPVWVSDDGEEQVCIGSIDELMEKANIEEKDRPTDLHMEFVDTIVIPSRMGKGVLKRVPYIFDCWFESGAVPIAQIHYPFENADAFDNCEFLSDFICEGLDQTRGWFYTLMVLSVALLNKPAFRTVICSGILLDKNGVKFSKKLGNYTNPDTLLERYGADALRIYLISSPAAHAEDFKFIEEDIGNIRSKLYQLYNGLRFFVEHCSKAEEDGFPLSISAFAQSDNVMDKWILSYVSNMVARIRKNMDKFEVFSISSELFNFVENLTNWYIKFNRNRLRRRFCDTEEQQKALSTLFWVYFVYCKLMSPFTPFMAEMMYQCLRKYLPLESQEESIHMYGYPDANVFAADAVKERRMVNLQIIASTIRTLRDAKTKGSKVRGSKVPINLVLIRHSDPEVLEDIRDLEKYLREEISVINIEYSCDNSSDVTYNITLDNKKVGTKYRSTAALVRSAVFALTQQELANMVSGEPLIVSINGTDVTMSTDEYQIIRTMNVALSKDQLSSVAKVQTTVPGSGSPALIVCDFTWTIDADEFYKRRLFVSFVQGLRKETQLRPWDKIKIYYETDDKELNNVMVKHEKTIVEELIYQIYPFDQYDAREESVTMSKTQIGDSDVRILITRPTDKAQEEAACVIEDM